MRIRKNVNLTPLSTFKIGGRVKFFCEAKNAPELLAAIRQAKKLGVSYKIIAGGSNIVFSDKNLNCLVIKIKSKDAEARDNKIIAEAGVNLMRVIDIATKNGLGGLEALSGIPGTIGGAVYGNAGAYGHSISEVIDSVEIWDPVFGKFLAKKGKRWLKNDECRFSYRESIFKRKPYIILRAVLKLQKRNPLPLKKISKEIINIRNRKYKPGICCPGSFFKNVLVKDISKQSLQLIDKVKIIDGKIPAGYLLEAAGAKGTKVGGIKVADFHCNLFINQGNGTAADVKKLARLLESRVKRKFGIGLEEEVKYF